MRYVSLPFWRGLTCFVSQKSISSTRCRISLLILVFLQTAAADSSLKTEHGNIKQETPEVEEKSPDSDDATRRRDLFGIPTATFKRENHPSPVAPSWKAESVEKEEFSSGASISVLSHQFESSDIETWSHRERSKILSPDPSPQQNNKMATPNLATPGGISDPALLQ